MFSPLDLLWLFFIFSSLQPVIQKALLAANRRRTLASIALKRDATVITLIRRQETMSLLGIPLALYIDDSQSVLRAIRETPAGKAIEIISHTPGGLVLAASQIARALSDHDGRIVAVVPHYAMSGGTLIALAADEILVDRHAALGPVDPQIGQYAARSLSRSQRCQGSTRTDSASGRCQSKGSAPGQASGVVPTCKAHG